MRASVVRGARPSQVDQPRLIREDGNGDVIKLIRTRNSSLDVPIRDALNYWVALLCGISVGSDITRFLQCDPERMTAEEVGRSPVRTVECRYRLSPQGSGKYLACLEQAMPPY